MWWFLYFSFRILTCSSVIHPVLKQACPSEKILSHMFMNREINISLLNASCLSCCLRWVTAFRLCAVRAVHVRHPFAVSAHVCRRLEKLRHLASVRLVGLCMEVQTIYHKSLMLYVAHVPISESRLSKIECYVTRIPI